MTTYRSSAAIALLFCSLAIPVWGQQYYLYESRPVTSEKNSAPKGAVLVTEIPVQKGDTLFDISRKYTGHGMYYPQILLFNNIKNPNLIYTGSTLKVPVTKGEVRAESAPARNRSAKPNKSAAANKVKSTPPKSTAAIPASAPINEIPPGELRAQNETLHKEEKHPNKEKIAKKKHTEAKDKVADKKNKTAAIDKPGAGSPVPTGSTASGQKLFERAVKAYKQDDFKNALELFDKYLADNSGSSLAADASLYKAECYLKLSSQ